MVTQELAATHIFNVVCNSCFHDVYISPIPCFLIVHKSAVVLLVCIPVIERKRQIWMHTNHSSLS
jgi:hypothetical protein